jgi:TonB family protein
LTRASTGKSTSGSLSAPSLALGTSGANLFLISNRPPQIRLRIKAHPAAAPTGKAVLNVDDLPQYKFAREVEHSPVAGGNPVNRYLTTVYGMIKAHLHETPELHLDRANKPGAVDFYVDKRGNLVGRKLISSSGSPNLDTAVMTAIAAAAPYPAPPNRRPIYLTYNFGRR